MKRPYAILSITLLLMFSQLSLAQEHKDCETAISLCGESPFYFESSQGVGGFDSGVGSSCVVDEYASTWISFSVLESGSISFILTSDSTNTDLDFVVFKFSEDEDCDNKERIRCMASGEIIGAPPESYEPCLGPTGLAEGETDVEEMPGCDFGDNNFLAPIEAEAGDAFVMLVNNFSRDSTGFTMVFGGTAVLDCTSLTNKNVGATLQNVFDVFPSPSSGLINIKLKDESFLGAQLDIYNYWGQVIFSQKKLSKMEEKIDLSNSAEGPYFLSLRKDKRHSSQSFYILK